MFKKLFSFALALCLIIPCSFALSACGDKKEKEPPVKIDVHSMAELQEALANDIDNDIIVLQASLDLRDVNDNKTLMIESGKHVLDLNGFTLKGVDNAAERNWHAIDVRGAETELTINDSSEHSTGTIEGRCYGIQVSRGAKLTINDGNFICTTNGSFNQSVVVYGADAVINGGNFVAKIDEAIFASSSVYDDVAYEANVTINNGVFTSIGEVNTEYDWGLLSFDVKEHNEAVIPTNVVINGGTFDNANLPYIIVAQEGVILENNADIPVDKIGQ